MTMQWALLLPWVYLLWMMLLLLVIVTSTTVAAPSEAFAVSAPAAGCASSLDLTTSRMGNGRSPLLV